MRRGTVDLEMALSLDGDRRRARWTRGRAREGDNEAICDDPDPMILDPLRRPMQRT